MSILTYPLGFIGGGKEFYNGVMENSLRFEDGDSPQLALTPASAGNRKTWTFSFENLNFQLSKHEHSALKTSLFRFEDMNFHLSKSNSMQFFIIMGFTGIRLARRHAYWLGLSMMQCSLIRLMYSGPPLPSALLGVSTSLNWHLARCVARQI